MGICSISPFLRELHRLLASVHTQFRLLVLNWKDLYGLGLRSERPYSSVRASLGVGFHWRDPPLQPPSPPLAKWGWWVRGGGPVRLLRPHFPPAPGPRTAFPGRPTRSYTGGRLPNPLLKPCRLLAINLFSGRELHLHPFAAHCGLCAPCSANAALGGPSLVCSSVLRGLHWRLSVCQAHILSVSCGPWRWSNRSACIRHAEGTGNNLLQLSRAC